MDNPYSKLGIAKLRRWPNQLIKGEEWDELEKLLTDLLFIEAGCANGSIYTLLGNFDRAQKHVQTQRFVQVRQSIIQCLDSVIDRPELCLQTLYNYLFWVNQQGSSPPDPNLEEFLHDTKEQLQRRSYWIRAAAPTPGGKSEQLLNIPFRFMATVQSLAADGRTLAIANSQGEVAFYNLDTGLPIDTEPHNIPSPVALALSNDPEHYLAWMDHQGNVRSSKKVGVPLQSHSKAKLLYHRTGGILTVNADDELIAWQPSDENDPRKNLNVKLPQPLIVFRFGPQVKQDSTGQDKAHVVYVAGGENPTKGIATWDGQEWKTNSIPAHSLGIVDADCDSEGKYLALLRRDRSIEVIEMITGKMLARTYYEKNRTVIIRGAPVHCAYHPKTDQIFFGTRDGDIAAWNWKDDQADVLVKYHGYCTPVEPQPLVMLNVLSQNNAIFFSLPNTAMTTTPEKPLRELTQHTGGVLDCFIALSGNQVISAGKQDGRLCWSTFEGLKPHAVRFLTGISMIAPYHNTDTALVGNKQGRIWRHPRDHEDRDAIVEIWHLFDGPVLSGFSPTPGIVIAVDQTSRVMRVQFDQENEKVEVLHYSQVWDEQIALFPAGNYGLYWSLRRTNKGTPSYVLSLCDGAGNEQIIPHTDTKIEANLEVNLTVSADGGTVCLFGRDVHILRQSTKGWTPFKQWPEMYIDHATFISGSGHLLAVTPLERPWLEIRDIDNDLAVIAAAWLPGKAPCLSSTGDRIIVGCQSGSLLSYEFIANRELI